MAKHGAQIQSLALCTIKPHGPYNTLQCHVFKCLSSISDLAQKQQFKSTLGKRSPYIIGNRIQSERPYQVSQLSAFYFFINPLLPGDFGHFSLPSSDYFPPCLN